MTFAESKFRRFLPAATFAMVVEFLMGISDSAVAGHVLGEDALSSVNLMQPVFNVVSFFATMVGVGASVLYSTAMGRFERRRACELFTQGLWSAVGLGLVMVAALALLRTPVLSSFGASPEVVAGADAYWRWFLPSAVFEPVAVFLAQMCYNDGDGRLCIVSYIAQLVGNCVLSVPLTMFMGLSGCALGTLLGNFAAIAVLCVHFRRRGNTLSLVRHFSFADTFRICGCSVGDACIRLCYAVLFFLLNGYVIARFGSDRLPVLASALAVIGLSEAFDGVGTAAQPLAAVYIGERNGRLTRRIMACATKYAFAEGAAMSAVLLAFPSLVVRLVGISDPEIAAEAAYAVRLVSIGLVGTSLMMLFNSYYMFLGERALAVLLTVLSALAVPFAMYVAMGAAFGAVGVWSALGAAPYAALALTAAWIAVRRGVSRVPLLLDRAQERNTRVFDLVLDEKSICAASESIGKFIGVRREAGPVKASWAALLVEEALMIVKDRNAGRRILAEVTVDLRDGLRLVLRDDGEIFDITDADAKVSSLRSYLVSNLMAATPARRNMLTTGFNRNAFRL